MPKNQDESGELSHNWEGIGPRPTIKPTSLTYAVGAGSDLGKRRKLNEDSIFASGVYNASLSFGLFVLADGMGGYTNGQAASSGAIQAIIDCILPKIVRSDALQLEAYPALLTEAVQLANEEVCQQNLHLYNKWKDEDVAVMTTVTAALVVGSTAYVANVGDSRTYLYREGEGLKKITHDHLWVARQIAAGILKPDDLYTHRARHVIERVLGGKGPMEVDIFTVQLQRNDTLLLCSGGLWCMVRDPKIEEILGDALPDPSKAAEGLIQSALDGGGKDNVSVIVASMVETQDQALVPGIQLFAKSDGIHLP